jgi:hypothetical protein
VADQADGFPFVDIERDVLQRQKSPLAVEKRWLTAWT